jgi:hypothetical protein
MLRFMKEQQLVYCPTYERFVQRAFSNFSQLITFLAFMFWNIYSISHQFNWIIIILINIISLISVIGLPIKYIFYIGSLIINEEKGNIEIILYRFDKVIKQFEISVEKLDVKVVEHWFYRRPIVELRLYSKGKFICKQRETSNWKVESFKKIRINILELQQNIRQKI